MRKTVFALVAILLIATQGAVVVARRNEHAADEQAFADLRRSINGCRHRHLGGRIEGRGQAAQTSQLEFVAIRDRHQILSSSILIEFGNPVGQFSGKLLGALGLANDAAIAIVRKSHGRLLSEVSRRVGRRGIVKRENGKRNSVGR